MLLEALANISIQLNDFESSLRYFIKCIEILEDLYATFHLVELNKKFKTKMQLFQISNRLSILHSNMALLLLKMNSLNAAGAVLAKANRFSGEVANKMTANLQLEASVRETCADHAAELAVKNDQNQLVFHETSETRLKSKFKRDGQFRHEDAGIMDAKYSFFFTSGLYE